MTSFAIRPALEGIRRLPRNEFVGALTLLVVTVGALSILDHWLPSGDVLLAWATARWPEVGSAPLPMFIAIAMLASLIGLSRQAIALLGGYLFGVAAGTLATLAALLVSATLVVLGARIGGRRLVAHRMPSIDASLRRFGATNPFAKTLAIRLLPVGSNLVTNLAAGVAGVALGPFLLASALGYVPQTLVFALAGYGVQSGGATALLGAVPLLLLSVLFAIWLGRRIGAR